MLRAKCHLAKSDLFVDCQLTIVKLNVKEKNNRVLSPVNIMQSSFSMLLPISKYRFLVTAQAVNRNGAPVDSEMFNISYVIPATMNPPKPRNLPNSGSRKTKGI